MKHIFPVFILIISIYIYSCANQGTPTGGPQDTIPPTLIESQPEHKSINFKGNKFHFVFDEKVNADKLKSLLIITPHIENSYKFKVRKNELTLEFENSFPDSTTYTLNFADGLVDVTEKNPAINLRLAFSTGHYIDSIYVNGKITDLYTNQDQKEFVVGLYELTDSLDLFKDKPRYFAKTNEQGQFLIENIKNGYYKIMSFKDENKNLILNPETEAHGFLKDSLNLNLSQDSIRIPTQLINATPLNFIRSKTTGRYFDVQYKKPFVTYKVSKLDSTNQLPIPHNNRAKSNKVLRFYPVHDYDYDKDSLGICITALDSMFNKTIDTVYIKFTESSRKAESFHSKYMPVTNSFIDPIVKHTYTFDKPIKTFYSDSVTISYDTLKTELLADSTIHWNENRTQLNFETLLDKKFLKTEIDTLLKIYGDTTLTDSISKEKFKYFSGVNTNIVSISFPKGTFMSIEEDSTEAYHASYQFKSLDQMGSVSGNINTKYDSFTIQLVDSNFQLIDQQQNTTNFNFPLVKPGKYTFRVLIDNDANGLWSYGNILKDEEPEQVYFYTEIFDVRANWQLENIQIDF